MKQRIAIAHVILKKPPIPLLDKANVSVDTDTEKLLHETLEKLMPKRTSSFIAHRLSTIHNVDRIYMLDGGEVVKVGTHKKLQSKEGVYTMLYRQSLMV